MKDNAGYNGCDRGVQEWVYISNRTSFPEALATRRTEESFTTQSDNLTNQYNEQTMHSTY